MAVTEHEQAELLDAYWAGAEPAGLGPQLRAVAARLQRRLRPPEPGPAFAARLRGELAAQQATSRRAPNAWSPTGRRLPWALAGLAALAVAALFALQSRSFPQGFVPFGPHNPRPIGATPAAQPTLAPGATEAPAAQVTSGPIPTVAPGSAPIPSWLATGPLFVADQGVTFGLLRALVHEPRFIDLFVAIGGRAAPDGTALLPADLKVLDGAGHELPVQVTWLDQTGGTAIGALTLHALDPEVPYVELRVSELRGGATVLRGNWVLRPLQRFQPGAEIRADSLEELQGLPCFRAGDVAVGDCWGSCDRTPQPVEPPPAAAATVAPLEGLEPPPLPPAEGAPPTEAPLATSTPAGLAPASPTLPLDLPPTLALPAATVTPVMGCEFTDWEHGVFGLTLSVGGPDAHRLYLLVERETGAVRRASADEFAQAQRQAY